DDNSRRRGRGAESRTNGAGESGKFIHIVCRASDANPADYVAILEQRHAATVHGIGVTVENIHLAGDDAQAKLAAIDGTRGANLLPRQKSDIQRAAAIGIFDPIERGVGGVVNSGREVNAAYETYGARGERRLVVAEIRSGARQSDG